MPFKHLPQQKMKIMKKSFLLPLLSAFIFTACDKNSDTVVDPPAKVTDTLSNTIVTNTTLDASKNYVINGQVYVKDGASLTIPAGTTVLVIKNDAPADKGALVITKGSKLFINGTVDQPVVFTSAAATKAPGDWGGIFILGKAPTNTGTGHIEGLPVSADSEYGGLVNDDNSGVINYLRLEYTGGLNPDAEDEWGVDKASGLLLASVGSGTAIDNVMVSHSNDDGFQFIGGTVNASHLIAYNNNDDDFDFDLGYTGKLQYLISYRTELNSTHALRANGFESYNDEVPTLNAPLTRPIVSNMTIIGPEGNLPTPGNINQGVYIRKGTRFVMQNSIIAEYTKGALMVCPKTRPVLMNNTGSLFKYNLVHSDTASRTFAFDHGMEMVAFADPQLEAFALNITNNNQLVTSSAELKLKTMYGSNGPDLTPAEGSPALTGASFDGADFSTFFSVVPYRGAIGSTNWAAASNWAVWK
jgi:hypothetical protein